MTSSAVMIGRVGKEPKMSATASGVIKAQFSLAISHPSGRGEKETDWWQVVCFGKVAELAERYVTKGMLLAVDGTARIQTYQRDGEDKMFPHVVARQISFLSRNEQSKSTNSTASDVLDDDVPF